MKGGKGGNEDNCNCGCCRERGGFLYFQVEHGITAVKYICRHSHHVS